MTQFAKRSATTMFIIGAIAVLFGIIAMIVPTAMSVSLVLVWGIYALVDGIISIVLAFRKDAAGARGWLIVNAILGILAGIIVLSQPIAGAMALGWVIGLWLVVRGILEFVAAFSADTGSPRWLQILSGIFWVLAGILFLTRPGVAIVSFTIFLGILALVWGITLIVGGFSARKAAKDASSAA